MKVTLSVSCERTENGVYWSYDGFDYGQRLTQAEDKRLLWLMNLAAFATLDRAEQAAEKRAHFAAYDVG